MLKLNAKMTRRKVQHILDLCSAVRAKYVWTAADQKLEEFLKKYIKTL